MAYRSAEEAARARESVSGDVSLVKADAVPAAVIVHLRTEDEVLWHGPSSKGASAVHAVAIAASVVIGVLFLPYLLLAALAFLLPAAGEVLLALATGRTYYVLTDREIITVRGKEVQRLYAGSLSDAKVVPGSGSRNDVILFLGDELVVRLESIENAQHVEQLIRARSSRRRSRAPVAAEQGDGVLAVRPGQTKRPTRILDAGESSKDR